MLLQEQPEQIGFILHDVKGDVNSNPMTQCWHRGIFNQLKHPELGVQFGMILVWDEKIKQYDPFWSFHVWNVNEDETVVYDNFGLMQSGIDEFKYELRRPINEWKIKVIDGSNLKAKKPFLECFDVIDKVSKPYKGQYDAIYLQNFGFHSNGKTQLTWDRFNYMSDEMEETMLQQMDGQISIDVVGDMSLDNLFLSAEASGANSLLTPDFEFYIKENGQWVKKDLGEEFNELKLELQK